MPEVGAYLRISAKCMAEEYLQTLLGVFVNNTMLLTTTDRDLATLNHYLPNCAIAVSIHTCGARHGHIHHLHRKSDHILFGKVDLLLCYIRCICNPGASSPIHHLLVRSSAKVSSPPHSSLIQHCCTQR